MRLVRNKFRYFIDFVRSRDLYSCLVIQSEHDVLIDMCSRIFTSHKSVKRQSEICWKVDQEVLNLYGEHQE